MYKVVLLQFAAACIVALLAGLLIGVRGAVSGLFGGLAYILPNLLFVTRLTLAAEAGKASSVTFFVGEFGKVFATILILVAAQHYYDVHWLAMSFGLFAALKANLFAFLLKT